MPISRDADRIHLAGVDDAHFYRADNLERAASEIPAGKFSILLSHTPRQKAFGFALGCAMNRPCMACCKSMVPRQWIAYLAVAGTLLKGMEDPLCAREAHFEAGAKPCRCWEPKAEAGQHLAAPTPYGECPVCPKSDRQRLWQRIVAKGLALLWQILSGMGFPNQFFCDSWVVGFWRGRPWLAELRIGEKSLDAGSGRFWIGWAIRRGGECVRSTYRG